MTQKLRTTLSILLALCAITTPAISDTVTLKDGTIIEGTVVSQADDVVKIEVKVSATITDEKTFPRADIAEVKILSEEDRAFENVQNLIPTPPLLTATDYARLIRSGPERFLTEYAGSKYVDEVKKVLAELEAEKARAADGSIKLENTWVTAAEQRRDRANVDAKILLYEMRNKAAAGDQVGALRDFDKLEADYIGTESFVAAIPVALKVLRSYGGAINASLADFDARMKLRQEKLQLLPDFRRQQNEAAFTKELADHAAAAARDEARGFRWTSFNANSKEGLSTSAAMVAAEIARVNELDREQFAAAAASLEQAKAYVQQRKLKQARGALQRASKLIGGKGAYYAQVVKNTDKLSDELKKEAEAAMDSESDKALALVKATKGTEAETASTGNPLQAMMQRRKAAAAAKKDEAGKAKAKAKAKAASTPKPPVADAPLPPLPPSSSGGGGLSGQKILFLLTGLLVVGLISAVVIQKKRQGG